MKAKQRNLLSLLLVVFVCAVLARSAYDAHHRSQDPALFGDPNQLVVETSYSEPWHKDLVVRRGAERLFKLKKGLRWGTGGSADRVLETLGPPKYKFDFLATEYFVWPDNVRYDWDVKQEFAGNYITIGFDFNDTVESVTITEAPPLDSTPTSLEEFQKRHSREWASW